ncbi:MAG: ABC transporter ATP-binding protein [Acidimicrobiales bacterium]
MSDQTSLRATGLSTGYGALRVLWDVDLTVVQGRTTVLLGANGAGKSTLLKALIGLRPLWAGTLTYEDESIAGWSPERRIAAGMSYVSETGIFAGLSVEDNLRVVATGLSAATLRQRLERTYEQFPLLAARRRESAGALSGGQRKLLTLAKGLVRDPRLLLMDEPSAGLSPLAVSEMVDTLAQVVAQGGVTLLLAEQNARVLELADVVTIIGGGRVTFAGPVEEFRSTADVAEQFFGLARPAPSAGAPEET